MVADCGHSRSVSMSHGCMDAAGQIHSPKRWALLTSRTVLCSALRALLYVVPACRFAPRGAPRRATPWVWAPARGPRRPLPCAECRGHPDSARDHTPQWLALGELRRANATWRSLARARTRAAAPPLATRTASLAPRGAPPPRDAPLRARVGGRARARATSRAPPKTLRLVSRRLGSSRRGCFGGAGPRCVHNAGVRPDSRRSVFRGDGQATRTSKSTLAAVSVSNPRF